MPFKSNTLLKSRLCLDYLNGGNACLNSSFILQIVVWRNGRSYHLQVQTFFAFIWPVFSTDPSDGISVTQPSQSSLISWHLRAKKILRLRGLGVLFIREAYLFTGAEYGGIFKAFFFITDKAR